MLPNVKIQIILSILAPTVNVLFAMAACAIHLHKNSLGNVFFHAIGDDICFGLGSIHVLRSYM